MGRSPGDSGSVGETARLWDAIRRKLGGLFAHIDVRSLPPERMVLVAPQQAWNLALAVEAGRAEPRWRPQAALRACPIPQAEAPPQDSDLAALTSVVSGNAALRPEVCETENALLPSGECVVEALTAENWQISSVSARSEPMRLTGGAVRPLSVGVIKTPGLRQIAGTALCPAKPRLGRATNVVLAHVPLRREARPAWGGASATETFESEQRRLSASSGVPLEDLLLIGVFPRIPVTAINRIALEADGSLSVWLRPEALASPGTLKWLTVILGRQRSTGKMLQAIM